MIIVGLPSTLSPLGQSFTSPSALGPPSTLLADNIDPETHDYNSLTTGIDPIDSQVLTALSVIRGSGAAVEDTGNKFADIRKITKSVRTEIDTEVRTTLGRLISAGDIRFDGTIFDFIDDGNQAVNIRIQWVNLRSGTGAVTGVNGII